MIKILKEGNSKKIVTCPECEAILEYTGVDVKKKYEAPDFSTLTSYIICPDCGEKIILNSEKMPEPDLPTLIGTTC